MKEIVKQWDDVVGCVIYEGDTALERLFVHQLAKAIATRDPDGKPVGDLRLVEQIANVLEWWCDFACQESAYIRVGDIDRVGDRLDFVALAIAYPAKEDSVNEAVRRMHVISKWYSCVMRESNFDGELVVATAAKE